ncbi:hypothetical protein OUZ56_019053 [Daphnia magna]|uniref:Uncharacterized protein n=2 Tax=Daphnia magna TaxID=35525 RepID=A0ABQ9ZBL2_9CRUS|nr:hypothetical protein OUZ56_019053 [Daphnia magna]
MMFTSSTSLLTKTLMHYSYLELTSTFKDQIHEVLRLVRQLTIQQRIHQQNVLKRKVMTKCRLDDFHAR